MMPFPTFTETMEWTVYDSKREDFTLVRASSQEEAVYRAAERGYMAYETDDARPRTGDAELMEKADYQEWLHSSFDLDR